MGISSWKLDAAFWLIMAILLVVAFKLGYESAYAKGIKRGRELGHQEVGETFPDLEADDEGIE